MKLEVTVSEIADIFKEIQERPGQLFEMIRLDIREVVGKYLTTMMNAELTHYLGRDPYVRVSGAVNHRNGSYGRGFALKGVGEVHVDVPRDRKGEFKTSVIPRSKQYEEEVARDFSILFLAGVSTRTLSMISERLIGRRISPAEISSVNANSIPPLRLGDGVIYRRNWSSTYLWMASTSTCVWAEASRSFRSWWPLG